MSVTVLGIVTGGQVVPDTPLPEGARVEVHLTGPPEVTAELQEEFAAWGRASERALTLIDEPRSEASDATG